VFQNLIGNAIKFRGGTPPVIQVQAARSDRDWLFTVADNGIGVPAEHAQEIFSIFKRLHTRREYPGNGIGLAICKRIIDQHHGKIWVESKEQGSAFKFTLPATAEGMQSGNDKQN
jgi:light-regulated signal transduction histidine kinase (bacteriophytochrome)